MEAVDILSLTAQDIQSFEDTRYLTPFDVYQAFLNICVVETQSEIGYLHLYCEDAEDIELTVWSDGVFERCTTSHETHYPLAQAGIWADAIRERRTKVHNDYARDASGGGLPEGHLSVNRHMSTAVKCGERIVAVIGVGNKQAPYAPGDAGRFEGIVDTYWRTVEEKLSIIRDAALKRKIAFDAKKPEDILISMVQALGRTLELKDEYTSDHHDDVAFICDKVAETIGLPDDQRMGLRVGSLLHDIGKVAIPAQILTKPSKLNAAEYALIKTHAEEGAKIFDDLDLPWPIRRMIGQHHERMDGSGYPRGLKREEICLEARIIAVADTFDAMASNRPYRKAPGIEKAVDTLVRGRGALFDPYIVDAFLTVLESDPFLNSHQKYIK